MTIFYSAARNGFFSSDLHPVIPDDAVRITPARHRMLLDAQASGTAIVAGEGGRPVLDRPRVSIADRRARVAKSVKREAARRIDMVSPIWRQINDMREPSADGLARFAAIDAIRAASAIIEAAVAEADAAVLDALVIAEHPAWPRGTSTPQESDLG